MRINSFSHSPRISTNVPKDMICDYFVDEMILIANEMTFELAPLSIFVFSITIRIPGFEAKLSIFIQAIRMKSYLIIITIKAE